MVVSVSSNSTSITQAKVVGKPVGWMVVTSLQEASLTRKTKLNICQAIGDKRSCDILPVLRIKI